MAKVQGLYGAIYQANGIMGNDIVFDAVLQTFTKASGGFSGLFSDGDSIIVQGSASNDGEYTLNGDPTDTVITVDQSVANESAGTSVIIAGAAPGTQMGGFYNWEMTDNCEMLECTNFGSSGWAEYLAGLKSFSGSAERYYLSDESLSSYPAAFYFLYLFTKYSANPSASTAYYYSGLALISGLSTSVPVDQIVNQSITFAGNGELTLNAQASAW